MNEVDLKDLDQAYADAEVVDGNDFKPVPDGKYNVHVNDVVLTTTKQPGADGKPRAMLAWTLEIVGPTHAGRLLWINRLLVTPENLRYAKTDLHLCGLTMPKLSEATSPASLAKLHGLHLEVTVKTKGEYTNVYLNKLLTDAPADDDADPIPF